jgi:hypothetical protein
VCKISAFRRLRQEDREFEANLSTEQDPASKHNKNKQTKGYEQGAVNWEETQQGFSIRIFLGVHVFGDTDAPFL